MSGHLISACRKAFPSRRATGRARRGLVVGIAFLGGLVVTEMPATATATFTKYTNMPIDYYVYEPSSYTGSTALPLVVYLHGCNQTAPDAALGTRWNEEAEARGFLAVYPEQRLGLISPVTTGNATRCWNFASPTDIRRGAGEAKIIADITLDVISNWNVDPSRVYIAGASAGGAMVSVLAATYPDIYAAGGIVAGCPYLACTDDTGALAYEAMGAHARAVPMFVAHSATDVSAVPYAMGERVVQEWLGVADLADDGLWNWSVPRNWASTENRGWTQTPDPLTGDPCISLSVDRLPCPGGVVGWEEYPHTIRRYNDANGASLLDFWVVYGASHGYVGGDSGGSFTDPVGPNITAAMADFFVAHPH